MNAILWFCAGVASGVIIFGLGLYAGVEIKTARKATQDESPSGEEDYNYD